MSDTQEKRPESQADPMETRADSGGTGGEQTRAAEHVVNEQARVMALDELDAARKQLLAAQEQMDAAQKRLSAIEKGILPSGGDDGQISMAPQRFAAIPPGDAAHEEAAGVPAPEEAKKEAAPQETAHYGVMNGLFDAFAKLGPIALLIFLACMAWPIFMPGANLNYCPAEIKSVTAILHMIATGAWFTPVGLENGAWTAPQWPVFSWCVALVGMIPGLAASGLLLPAVSFGCVFLAVFAVWALTLATGFGARAAMAAAIILLCAPLFAPMPHFVGPAALAAALMLFALLFFYRGWIAVSSWICLPLAFICTALAGLCGGILHFATPLVASICFLIWRGNLRRGHKLDAVFGFILLLVIIGCWLGALMMGQGNETYLNALFASSWQFAIPMPLKWLLPIIVAALGLLPWILIVFGVSWARVIAKCARSFSASRHENGSAMLWISIALALAISIFVPWFHPSAIAIACLGAILLGKAFVRMPHFGNCLFFLLASLCVIIAGGLILAVTFPSSQTLILNYLPALPVSDLGARLMSLPALRIIGGILLVGGLLGLFFVKRFRAAGGLFYAMLLVIILCQPARLMLVPELSAMPGTPLVSFEAIEKQVVNALLPPATAPAAEPVISDVVPAPADAATAPTEPQAAPQTGNAGAASEPAQTPAANENPAPNAAASAPDQDAAPEAPASQPGAEPAPAPAEEVIIIEEPAADAPAPAQQGQQ